MNSLDIIVPHYKEPWHVCKYLLDTIACQRGILFDNLRVILVNDGYDCDFYLDHVPDYPYEIISHTKEHEGVSAARNYGLDHSDADYVMFCDCDDGFLNNYALHLIFSGMQEGFDVCVSNFVEETWDDKGNPRLAPHDQDLTFMHGKAYRRQFLIDYDLRFDPAMTLHEDGYFNMLVYTVAQHEGKIKTINTPIYLWCWNENSTVRSNVTNFVLRTYDSVMQTRTGLCRKLKARGYEEDFRTAVCMTVLNSYYDFQKTSYTEAKNAKYRKIAEKAFKRYWDEFKSVFTDCTNQKIAEIARVARENAYKNGMLYEQASLKAFLKYIDTEVKA